MDSIPILTFQGTISTKAYITHLARSRPSGAILVRKMEWYKEKHGCQHEWLVATLAVPHGVPVIHLAVERTVIIGDQNKSLGQNLGLVSPSSFPTHNASRDCFSSYNDRTLKERCASSALIAKLIPGTPLPILELSRLAYVVSCQAPKYSLMDENCYWFGKLLWNTTCTLFSGTQTSGDAASRGGRFSSSAVAKDNPSLEQKIRQEYQAAVESSGNAMSEGEEGASQELSYDEMADRYRAMQQELQQSRAELVETRLQTQQLEAQLKAQLEAQLEAPSHGV